MKNPRKQHWKCRIDPGGRLVLPRSVRTQVGLQDGDRLVVSIEDGAIVLRSYEEALQKLQTAFCEGLDEDVSLSAELIEERRREVRRE